MNPQPTCPPGQVPPVQRPRPVPTVSPEEERFRQYFLSVNPMFDVLAACLNDNEETLQGDECNGYPGGVLETPRSSTGNENGSVPTKQRHSLRIAI